MLTVHDEARTMDAVTPERPSVEAVIAEGVLGRLGEPDGLHSVQVKRAFGDMFRVNVWVRAGMGTHRVAHSFFVQADARGSVLSSTPAITRVY